LLNAVTAEEKKPLKKLEEENGTSFLVDIFDLAYYGDD